jgi:MSHA pilin protein MshC
MRARSGAPTGSTGYTVVELVVVIAILGILASFAAPRFFSAQPFDERGYADALAGALRATRNAAVASGCPARFDVDVAGYRARLPAASGNGCSAAGAWSVPVPLPDGSVVGGERPASIPAATATLVFLPSGGLQASTPPLTVGDWLVAVDATTGYVALTRR